MNGLIVSMGSIVSINVGLFALLAAALARWHMRGATTASSVLIGLLLGTAYGAALQAVYGLDHEAVRRSLTWIGVVSGGYLRLLQMIVMPLVLLSILSAVTRIGNGGALGKISGGVLGVLFATTAASAAIGIGVAHAFGLSAASIVQGTREVTKGAAMQARVGEIAAQSVPELLLSFFPTNIFADLAGTRETSVIAVVVFSTLLGLAVLSLYRKDREVGKRVADGIETLQRLVMQLVALVLRFTPYGVLALMTRVAATSDVDDIRTLVTFVAASYLGMALILGLHGALLTLAGLSPVRFFRRVWPVLTFAFSSRSSAATIPLTIETQVSRLGVPSGIATFAASFGATMGQNACAGLYPAMLAFMIAPSAGVDPLTPSFVGTVVLVATLGSLGSAGFGGGATVAAILVLSTLGLPVALAGLLISVEPLIDMGRTAVNVNGALVAGVMTSRFLGETDLAVLHSDEPAAAEAAKSPLLSPVS